VRNCRRERRRNARLCRGCREHSALDALSDKLTPRFSFKAPCCTWWPTNGQNSCLADQRLPFLWTFAIPLDLFAPFSDRSPIYPLHHLSLSLLSLANGGRGGGEGANTLSTARGREKRTPTTSTVGSEAAAEAVAAAAGADRWQTRTETLPSKRDEWNGHHRDV